MGFCEQGTEPLGSMKCGKFLDLLLLPLTLQPTVGFGLSNNVLFFPICLQLSPSSHSQHLKISFYFLFPSFPGSFHVARNISVYPVFFRPSSFNLSNIFLYSTFVKISFFFYWVVLLAPRQTPNLEDQGILFCLGHHL